MGEPWLAWLDVWVGDGDPRRTVLGAVAYVGVVGLLAVAVKVATARWGRPAAVGWLVVAAVALPLAAFLPGRSTGSDSAERVAFDALGLSSIGGPLAVVAFLAMGGLIALLVGVQPRPGATSGPWRRTLALWTAGVLAVGVVMAFVVDSYPTRAGWLATTADEIAGGDAGVTGSYQIGLDTSRAETVPCETAAQALSVDGERPELAGCRSAMLVEAVGRVGEGAERTSTGSLVAVVVQTRTIGRLERLDADLDGVELVAGAGLPAAPGETIASPARAAYALVVAAEDPGDAPLGEGAARLPLTRALAYAVIGTAQGWYLAPPEVAEVVGVPVSRP